MSEITNKTTKNATIQQYISESDTSSSKDSLIHTETLNTNDLKALAEELRDEEIKSVIDGLIDEGNILNTVQTVTDDEILSNNIDEIKSNFTTRPSLIKSAAETIADELGMKPFTVQVEESNNDFQDPMVQLTVEPNVVVTNNPEINAELFNYACRIKATTGSGQKRLFERWCDVLSKSRIIDFKEDRHPDALGFTIPEQIPATGDEQGRTPITEIPFIGEATATDIHPTGKLMSIEDYIELTPKQTSLIEFPIDKSDYSNRRTRGVAKGIVEQVPDETTDTLGKALQMMDRRENSDDELSWVDTSYAFGIAPNDEIHASVDLHSVESVNSSGDHITVTLESNSSSSVEKRFSRGYWGMLELISEASNSEIGVGDYIGEPAFVELPDGGVVLCAPRVND